MSINLIKEPNMKNFRFLLFLAALALAIALSGLQAGAQPDNGGGGYNGGGYGGYGAGGAGGAGGLRNLLGDPAQRTQMVVDGLRDTLMVTNDDEWSVIAPRLLKVVQLRSDSSTDDVSRMVSSFASRFGGGAGGRAGAGGGLANLLGTQPDPAADALRAALEGNGSVAQIKAALANYRAVKQQKQAEMAKAQAALKEVLTVRQEATLTLAGYLE
jgi:hypothetical protein